MLALMVVAALVADDNVALRSIPHETAPRQALLGRGDWLEVRGEHAGFVQVYDHRRERPGYVRPWQVRRYDVDPSSAASLRAVIDFLREQPGAESLGIGYVALYLRIAPAQKIDSDLFDALGSMADRLARRASLFHATAGDLATQREVAESYGIHFTTLESEGRATLCYDGEAFRRVLAMNAPPLLKARAALGLTRPECVPETLSPWEMQQIAEWQRDVDDRADAGTLPSWMANRLHLRRATVLTGLAFGDTRRGDQERAKSSSASALRELALVERTELTDEDLGWYDDARVRVAATRWADESVPPPAKLHIVTSKGEPGQTCIALVEGKTELLHRCTFAIVWEASAQTSPRANALALAVQPLAGWVELWVFHRTREGADKDPHWTVDLLAPAISDPRLGYVELAGFSPDGTRLLVAREFRGNTGKGEPPSARWFQVLRLDAPALPIEKEAHLADRLIAFNKWSSTGWRAKTLALR